jgi:hypothetical protein
LVNPKPPLVPEPEEEALDHQPTVPLTSQPAAAVLTSKVRWPGTRPEENEVLFLAVGPPAQAT